MILVPQTTILEYQKTFVEEMHRMELVLFYSIGEEVGKVYPSGSMQHIAYQRDIAQATQILEDQKNLVEEIQRLELLQFYFE
jgi:hypothetical protein